MSPMMSGNLPAAGRRDVDSGHHKWMLGGAPTCIIGTLGCYKEGYKRSGSIQPLARNLQLWLWFFVPVKPLLPKK